MHLKTLPALAHHPGPKPFPHIQVFVTSASHFTVWKSALISSGCYNKYHRLSGLNNRNSFPTVGGWKSEVKVPEGLVSGEASLLSLQMTSSQCVLKWLFPFVQVGKVREERKKSLVPLLLRTYNLEARIST